MFRICSSRQKSTSSVIPEVLFLGGLFPRILVANWAVLELLAADGYFLVVLLAVCPILLEMYAVAACTLDGLHG